MAGPFARLDADLPERFIAAAMQSPRRLGQPAAFCFRKGGVAEVRGKKGDALVYRRVV